MTCHQICISIISAIGSISVTLAQAETPIEPAPHHEIVPQDQ
jgi:hypothetical protein